MDKIAILLTTHNGEKYLGQMIDSLLAQTRRDFVIYVHDDGSVDDTLAIVADYARSNPDRIKVMDGPDTGSAKANFMWMLERVEAQVYLLADQDDVWLERKVEKSLEALEILEDFDKVPACVFTDMYVVDEKLQIMADSFIRYIGREPGNVAYTQILIDNPAAGCTMCFNRQLRDIAINTADVDFDKVPMHDVWILELAAICGRVAAIDEPLVYYRQTGENTMGAVTESGSDKVARNVSLARKGGFFARKKAFVMEARHFAAQVVKVPGLPEDRAQLLQEFADIGRCGKLRRMKFYKEHNFTRAKHNLWMRLWV